MAIIELLICCRQSIGKIKEVSIVIVLQKIILPIVCLFALSAMFSIDGIR